MTWGEDWNGGPSHVGICPECGDENNTCHNGLCEYCACPGCGDNLKNEENIKDLCDDCASWEIQNLD